MGGGGRLVWSSEKGSLCPGCGWPVRDCRCSSTPEEPVPAAVTAKLRLEKKGRAGKSVTVLDGLPRNRAFLAAIATELRAALGTGGTVRDGSVELQGDHRERLRGLLARRGWSVKG